MKDRCKHRGHCHHVTAATWSGDLKERWDRATCCFCGREFERRVEVLTNPSHGPHHPAPESIEVAGLFKIQPN